MLCPICKNKCKIIYNSNYIYGDCKNIDCDFSFDLYEKSSYISFSVREFQISFVLQQQNSELKIILKNGDMIIIKNIYIDLSDQNLYDKIKKYILLA